MQIFIKPDIYSNDVVCFLLLLNELGNSQATPF